MLQESAPQIIEIVAPPDGGTPRDPTCIQRQGGRAFHVTARREEGANSLSHAISRLELIMRNHGGEPECVELTIDLGMGAPGAGRDTRWTAPQERDYVYIHPPEGRWQRVDGRLDASGAVVVALRLPPGDTLVALSPCYGYGDYCKFVNALPQSPLLSKTLLGQSDGGREHWALHITDPNAPAGGKLRVMLSARAHAYETCGSFAIEGLVNYLLSNPPGANLGLFEFLVQPMLNVDGVALGYEYAEGFEHGPKRDLKACASGRLYFSCIEEWQPHVLVSLHNWITPRACDVFSYTDVDAAGGRSDRAQEVFRRFFPPQTEFGKSWLNDIDAPLTHNWARENEKAAPDLSNPEVYARIRYGTEIWVPELPWFGRDDDDPTAIARAVGHKYVWALIQTLARTHALPGAVLEPSQEVRFLGERGPIPVISPGSCNCQGGLLQGPVMLDRVLFSHGLMLPVGESRCYDLDGLWETFCAVTGLVCGDDSRAPLELYVKGDGRLLWTSAPRVAGDRRQRIEINVRGVRVLTLGSRMVESAVGDAGVVWADAKVRRPGRV